MRVWMTQAATITAAEWIDGDHDDHALENARARCKVGAFELWDRDRLVGRSKASAG